jgi:1-acyl-sn-glycerol-3-phosphate acyltransferase
VRIPSLVDFGRAGWAAIKASRSTASAATKDLLGSGAGELLEARDAQFIRETLPLYREVVNLYFRAEVRGLERIPAEGPVLVVGNHSGGFYSHFGPARRFHPLSHDVAVKLPALSALLRKYGGLPASTEWAEKALEHEAAVLVYPGGEIESFRPSLQSAKIDFAGRKGWIRLALSRGVPIVPLVAIGGQETALFLTRGRRLAKLLQLDRVARLKVFPIQLGPPFGVTALDLPMRFPLPSKLTIQVLPKVDLRERFGEDPAEDEVYQAITADMQAALDALAAERRLPVVG